LVKFLFDANAFITPFNIYYHPEIAPGFWLKLKNYFETRNFYTIKKIVTFEKYSNSPTTPNIPAVCEKLNFNFSIALQQNYELIWEIKNLDHLSSCKCITLFEAMYLAGVRI